MSLVHVHVHFRQSIVSFKEILYEKRISADYCGPFITYDVRVYPPEHKSWVFCCDIIRTFYRSIEKNGNEIAVDYVYINRNSFFIDRERIEASQVFHINENSDNLFIGRVQSVTSKSIKYLIANQDIPEINVTSDGFLYANYPLDRETKENYSITITGETLDEIEIIHVSS